MYIINAIIHCHIHTNHEYPLRYTPAYGDKDGKHVRSKLIIPFRIPVHEFDNKPMEPYFKFKYGPPVFNFVAYGERADALAKQLTEGKSMHFICGDICQDGFIVKDFTWGQNLDGVKAPIIKKEVVS